MDEIAVLRLRVGGARDLKSSVDLAQFAFRLQTGDRLVHGRDRLPGARRGDAVLRDAHPACLGELLELSGERRLGALLLFPDLQPIGEDELRSPAATAADGAGLEVEACNVIGADEAVRFYPDHGHAGSAQIVFRELIVVTIPHARADQDSI